MALRCLVRLARWRVMSGSSVVPAAVVEVQVVVAGVVAEEAVEAAARMDQAARLAP